MVSRVNDLDENNGQITEVEAKHIIENEINKFEGITGPTTLTQHEIRVKPNQQQIFTTKPSHAGDN